MCGTAYDHGVNSYRIVVVPVGYKRGFGPGKRYAYEHRLVVERRLGRLLRAGEVVHHKNRNRRDNRASNLEVLTRSDHSKHHVKRAMEIRLTCSECLKTFSIPQRRYRQKVKQNNKNFYCGRSCMGSRQGRANKGRSGRRAE